MFMIIRPFIFWFCLLKAENLVRTTSNCDECKLPFEYDGMMFDGCTSYRWASNINNEQPMSWCVTDKEAFKDDEATGWDYCSVDCLKDSSKYAKIIKILCYVMLSYNRVVVIFNFLYRFHYRQKNFSYRSNEWN